MMSVLSSLSSSTTGWGSERLRESEPLLSWFELLTQTQVHNYIKIHQTNYRWKSASTNMMHQSESGDSAASILEH